VNYLCITDALPRSGLRDWRSQLRFLPQINWTGRAVANFDGEWPVIGRHWRNRLSDAGVCVAFVAGVRGVHRRVRVVGRGGCHNIYRRMLPIGRRVLRLFAGRCVAVMHVRDQRFGVIHAEAEGDDEGDEATEHGSVNGQRVL
jgi:hypothetical protein